jgi:outer membrane protein TolC
VVLDPLALRLRAPLAVALTLVLLGSPQARAQAEGAGTPTSLRDAVLRALAKNLDLEVERVDPVLAGFRVEEAKAAFDDTFQWTAEFQDVERFANSVLEQLPQLDDDGTIDEKIFTPRWEYGGRATRGTEYSISLVTPIVETNNPLRLFDRSYTPQLGVNFRQPLLRNRSRSVNLVRVHQAETLERQSDAGLRVRMLQLVGEVERNYWTSVYAEGRLRIARESLTLAESLIRRLESMRESGMAKEFDLLRPRLEAEKRRSEIARAEADLDIALARLRAVVDPTLDAGMRLAPTDPTPEAPPAPEYASHLETAYGRRPELEQQAEVIRGLELEREYADDQTHWRFDATARANYGGLAGEDPGPLVFGPTSIDRDSYFDAFKEGAVSWAIGFDLLIPLGRRPLLAGAGPARARLQQETTRLQAIKGRIASEVETAHRDTTAEWTRLGIARRATALAREQYEIQGRNMETGLATVLQVIEAQDYLTQTQEAENTARLRYALATSRFATATAAAAEDYQIQPSSSSARPSR